MNVIFWLLPMSDLEDSSQDTLVTEDEQSGDEHTQESSEQNSPARRRQEITSLLRSKNASVKETLEDAPEPLGRMSIALY